MKDLENRFYVMRLSVETPFFVESFVDYGFNRMAHFQHLRQRGAQMYVVPSAFVVHKEHAA